MAEGPGFGEWKSCKISSAPNALCKARCVSGLSGMVSDGEKLELNWALDEWMPRYTTLDRHLGLYVDKEKIGMEQ